MRLVIPVEAEAIVHLRGPARNEGVTLRPTAMSAAIINDTDDVLAEWVSGGRYSRTAGVCAVRTRTQLTDVEGTANTSFTPASHGSTCTTPRGPRVDTYAYRPTIFIRLGFRSAQTYTVGTTRMVMEKQR